MATTGISITWNDGFRAVWITAILLSGTAPIRAQDQRGPAREPARPGTAWVARAIRIPGGTIHLDGRLTEAAWTTAPAVTGFVQRDPYQGRPASEPSEVRVLYTDDALFVGFRAWDDDPAGIRAILTRRDDDSPSDWVLVAIDSYHDRRTAFAFAVNPAGVRLDFLLSDDDRRDDSWDAVWDAKVTRDARGWTAEFRIPFSQLRFAPGTEHRFGFQLVRFIRRRGEEDHWRLMPKDEAGIVSRFGELIGITGIRAGRRIEALPYAAATVTREPAADRFRLGGDLTAGVSPNVTLSATIHPDFGQVEADPAVVNLSAFETFYPEQRPFFLEGMDLYRFPIALDEDDNEALFYTRRIGRAPQGAADPRGGRVSAPGQTTILGAAKLSGKTPGGWGVGLLTALTAPAWASVVDSAGVPAREIVEPTSGYAVGRLSRDFRHGATQVGAFGTLVLRDLPDNLAWLRRDAYAGGLRWTHRFAADAYVFRGWVAGSLVRGSPRAITLTQRASTHYYQRPDAEHLRFDTTRTALAGAAAQIRLSRNAGSWLWSAGADTRSPGFEVNDIGFQRSADRTTVYGWLSRRWLEPGRLFRRVETEATVWNTWTYGAERTATSANASAWFQLRNLWEFWASTDQALPALDPYALRGGPAMLRPYAYTISSGVESDERARLRGGLRGWWTREPASGRWGYQIAPTVAWRPAPNVDLSAAPTLTRQRDTWQYLTTAAAAGTAYYLFGDLAQTTVALSLRANITFAPALSLQAWMQPFVSSGDYAGYRTAAAPRARHFADRLALLGPTQVQEQGGQLAIDLDGDGAPDLTGASPDFTALSLRANLVLRWEYAPGSTLFLVWQHGRSGRAGDGTFALGRSLDELWALPAANTVALKVNYWLGR